MRQRPLLPFAGTNLVLRDSGAKTRAGMHFRANVWFCNLPWPAGTAKYVHKACLQKWVTEKGNLKCEICGQSYKGGYRVPPPRERQPPDDLPEHARFLFRERFMDVYDDDHARLRRQSGTSW